jgi:hypothetical protein
MDSYAWKYECHINTFRGGAAVAQVTVNHLVVGSNPTPGAN